MKTRTWIVLSFCLLLLGGFVLISSGILIIDKERDIIKYDGRIYSNATDLEWFEKEKDKYRKGEKVGEIKRQTNLFLFMWNFSATQLTKGTALYRINGAKEGIRPDTILVETENGEFLYYIWLPKE